MQITAHQQLKDEFDFGEGSCGSISKELMEHIHMEEVLFDDSSTSCEYKDGAPLSEGVFRSQVRLPPLRTRELPVKNDIFIPQFCKTVSFCFCRTETEILFHMELFTFLSIS